MKLLICFIVLALFCVSESKKVEYPDEKLPQGVNTLFSIVSGYNALHLFALGADGNLWHRYQMMTGADEKAPWSAWILRAKAPNGSWNSDPTAGMGADGTIEVFIRYTTNLDVWQIYQLNPADPNSWSKPRESSCVDLPCNDTDPTHFWNTQPVFPTSDLTMLNDKTDGSIQLYYRGFNGALFRLRQKKGTHSYNPPEQYDVIVV
eukprot:TRINITY_DN6091_c0_g1_i1.p1 TRINITY_DN6091_c0_g1~~TRINITY_DN6091_c0_g1_i1.p1  ORF type:complete len:215 (+),score=42.60 TRINITY_DN6091_c0_g1_i1:33-647(+)